MLVRLYQGDAQCLVAPSSNRTSPACWELDQPQAEVRLAEWYGSNSASSGSGRRRRLQQQQTMPSRTLTCGQEWQLLFNRTGYEDKGSWCTRAREALSTRGLAGAA